MGNSQRTENQKSSLEFYDRNIDNLLLREKRKANIFVHNKLNNYYSVI